MRTRIYVMQDSASDASHAMANLFSPVLRSMDSSAFPYRAYMLHRLRGTYEQLEYETASYEENLCQRDSKF